MNAPEYVYLQDDDGKNQALLLLDEELGVFYRDAKQWVPLYEDEDSLPYVSENLNAVETSKNAVEEWDRVRST